MAVLNAADCDGRQHGRDALNEEPRACCAARRAVSGVSGPWRPRKSWVQATKPPPVQARSSARACQSAAPVRRSAALHPVAGGDLDLGPTGWLASSRPHSILKSTLFGAWVSGERSSDEKLTAAESLVTKPSRRHIWRLLARVLAIVVVGSALAVSASAQFFEDRPWSYRPRHSPFSSPSLGHRWSPGPTFSELDWAVCAAAVRRF